MAPAEGDSAADAFSTVGFRWLSVRGVLALACFTVAIFVPGFFLAIAMIEPPTKNDMPFFVAVFAWGLLSGCGFAVAGAGVGRQSRRMTVVGLCVIAVAMLPVAIGILRSVIAFG